MATFAELTTYNFKIMQMLLKDTKEVLEVKDMHFIPTGGMFTKVHFKEDDRDYEITIKDTKRVTTVA